MHGPGELNGAEPGSCTAGARIVGARNALAAAEACAERVLGPLITGRRAGDRDSELEMAARVGAGCSTAGSRLACNNKHYPEVLKN